MYGPASLAIQVEVRLLTVEVYMKELLMLLMPVLYLIGKKCTSRSQRAKLHNSKQEDQVYNRKNKNDFSMMIKFNDKYFERQHKLTSCLKKTCGSCFLFQIVINCFPEVLEECNMDAG